jgi:hypothetical protein
MSKIKKLIENELEDHIDEFRDDDYWCHYAGMPSPNSYDNTEGVDEE